MSIRQRIISILAAYLLVTSESLIPIKDLVNAPTSLIAATTILSNKIQLPLLGIGIGALPSNQIKNVVSMNLFPESNLHLIETGAEPKKGAILSEEIQSYITARTRTEKSKKIRGATQAISTSPREEIHVITKVSYNQLGYERTRLSIEESLYYLRTKFSTGKVDVKVHVILNKQDAWRESWRALEDMYDEDNIHSIGVSNFDVSDMHELLDLCRITPHIYQGSAFDRLLIDFLRGRGIFFQAYNLIEDMMANSDSSRTDYDSLTSIAKLHGCTVRRLVLSYLFQNGIGVITQASSTDQIGDEFSAVVTELPILSDMEDNALEVAISALFTGTGIQNKKKEDAERKSKKQLRGVKLESENKGVNHGVQATFFNVHSDPVNLFWLNKNKDEEMFHKTMASEEVYKETTFPGHTFIAYDERGRELKRFQVIALRGESESFRIESDLKPIQDDHMLITRKHTKIISEPLGNVSFFNALSYPVTILWFNTTTGEQNITQNIADLNPGKVIRRSTFPGHRFGAYDGEGREIRRFEVTVHNGERQDFHIELKSNESKTDRVVHATFFNALSSAASVFWINDTTGEEVINNHVEPGKIGRRYTKPGHVFVAYDAHGAMVRKFEVTADYGATDNFHIKAELESSETNQTDIAMDHAVSVKFFNALSTSVRMFWIDNKSGEEKLARHMEPGEIGRQRTSPGHVFVAYDEHNKEIERFKVTADFGGSEDFHVELDLKPDEGHQAQRSSNNRVHVTFFNALSSAARVFLVDSDTGGEVFVKHIEPGEIGRQRTFPGYIFVVYDEHGNRISRFQVSADYGEKEDFHIEEMLLSNNTKHAINITFFNSHSSAASVFQVHSKTGEEVPVMQHVQPGMFNRRKANAGSTFVVYDDFGGKIKTFQMIADHMVKDGFHFEL